MKTVTFGLEVLTTQVKFEQNKKIKIEFTDTIREGETFETAFSRVKKLVNDQMLREIVGIANGRMTSKQLERQNQTKRLAKAASTQYGLDFTDDIMFDHMSGADANYDER